MDTRAVMPSEIPTIRWSGRGLDVVVWKAKLIKLHVIGKQRISSGTRIIDTLARRYPSRTSELGYAAKW